MISLLVYVLILFLVFGLIWYLIGLFPLQPPFGTALRAVVAVIFVVCLLYVLMGLVGDVPRLGRL